MKHGTLTGYNYHRCRCDECRAANASYRRQYESTPEGRRVAREVNARSRHAFRGEIGAIKLAAQCMDCDGTFDDPSVLEFDHRDPDSKLFNVAAAVSSRRRAATYAEIEKCDVVCKPCHVERTKARGQYVEAGRKGGKVRYA